jgi:hypothetical protein
MSSRKFVITTVSNPLSIQIPYALSSISGFSIDRFEWYPTQTYSSSLPQLQIQGDITNASYAIDGTQTSVLFSVMRNSNGCYKRVRQVTDELYYCTSTLPSTMNLYITDQNGDLIDLGGGLNGMAPDSNSVNYLLEFSLYY